MSKDWLKKYEYGNDVPVPDINLTWSNGDLPNQTVSVNVINTSKIREEHEICLKIRVATSGSDKLAGPQAVAIGFETLDSKDQVMGIEAISVFRIPKSTKVGSAGAWYPGVTAEQFNKADFNPKTTPFKSQSIWVLDEEKSKARVSAKKSEYVGYVCRAYSAGEQPWKYRVARNAVLSVQSKTNVGIAPAFKVELIAAATSGLALASTALLTYCLF